MKHVTDRIQACLDGELPPEEVARVREHCAGCSACDRAWREAEALWRLVDAAEVPQLERSLWPGLRARLHRRPARRARLVFSAAAAAATVAGLLLGFELGGVGVGGAAGNGAPSFLDQGSLLVEDAELTLDQVYLAAGATDQEVQR
jgi:anti-sigma factor RsiW